MTLNPTLTPTTAPTFINPNVQSLVLMYVSIIFIYVLLYFCFSVVHSKSSFKSNELRGDRILKKLNELKNKIDNHQ